MLREEGVKFAIEDRIILVVHLEERFKLAATKIFSYKNPFFVKNPPTRAARVSYGNKVANGTCHADERGFRELTWRGGWLDGSLRVGRSRRFQNG
jgi:hypothetical protein